MESRLIGGRFGRVLAARLLCNDDLVESIEELCVRHDVKNAVVKGALGSLFRTQLEQTAGDTPRTIEVEGFAVELLSLSGNVSTHQNSPAPAVNLFGIVADNQGHVFAGKFVRGSSPTCITIEMTVQEWLPD